MNKWEYISRFIWAEKENWKAYDSIGFYNQELATDRSFSKESKYSPLFMIGILNDMGEKGWELIHMEPAGVGNNEDVMVGYQNSAGSMWSHAYFCVFKRLKQS